MELQDEIDLRSGRATRLEGRAKELKDEAAALCDRIRLLHLRSSIVHLDSLKEVDKLSELVREIIVVQGSAATDRIWLEEAKRASEGTDGVAE